LYAIDMEYCDYSLHQDIHSGQDVFPEWMTDESEYCNHSAKNWLRVATIIQDILGGFVSFTARIWSTAIYSLPIV
jgi:hypothetical protein